ncbi:unnamed protein product, partial [Mesorhabditis spiculigera]
MLLARLTKNNFHRFLSTTTLKRNQQFPAELIDPCCDPAKPIVVGMSQITEAAYGIRGAVEKTLCRYSRALSHATGIEVYLKMEQTQTTGSFKERGARWALMNLTADEKKKGVYAASAGNHAQALCIHGNKLGIPITVVMPRHAPIKKIAQCQQLGGKIIVKGKDISESRHVALTQSLEAGGKYINGYDHEHVIAGAGTVGLEILDQNSLEAGQPIRTPVMPTLADGLAVPLIGFNAFATALGKIDESIVVDEKTIGLAILRLVEMEKVSVSDRPWGIAELTELVAKEGGSIKDIFLERSWTRSDVFTVRTKVVAETRDSKHARRLEQALRLRYADDCIFHLFPTVDMH